MAVPVAPVPSPVAQMQFEATRASVAAILTAALVGAANRPHSVAEILEIQRDVLWSLYPKNELSTYQEWLKTKDERLQQVHA